MTTHLTATTRRSIGVAALWLALAGLGGCVAAPPGTVPDSLGSYDRTFDTALQAMVDQKLTISHQDRRQGTIIGSLGGTTIAATLDVLYEGTIRVVFKQQGETPADPALLQRVADAYNARMSQARILPGGLL
ncbi:MAG TPA: hypothetical protein VET87_23425 [Rubrivivax sp.]|nr:hypothetical protein [Rubrivivax sp.]